MGGDGEREDRIEALNQECFKILLQRFVKKEDLSKLTDVFHDADVISKGMISFVWYTVNKY